MKTFVITFRAREKGALGITETHTKEIEAETIREAHLKLYDTYEHIYFMHHTHKEKA